MERVGIWERNGEITRLFRALLPPEEAASVQLRSRRTPFPPGEAFGVLLLGPEREGAAPSPPPCRLLLLPGEEAPLAARCQSFCTMSYGLSERDSLTLSASGGGQYALSVQRELLTVSGRPVERQELILKRRTEDPLLQMAAAALLLLLDVPAEALPELFRGMAH